MLYPLSYEGEAPRAARALLAVGVGAVSVYRGRGSTHACQRRSVLDRRESRRGRPVRRGRWCQTATTRISVWSPEKSSVFRL